MNYFSVNVHPHERLNLLTGEWILVSPHRSKRPWQGKVEQLTDDNKPSYNKQCYLCPGNSRVGGKINPEYTGPYVFNNDFAALLPDTPEGEYEESGLLKAKGVSGICRVICFSPRHNLTLPLMEISEIEKVVNLWKREYLFLASDEKIKYIQIFENKGEIMGCSNPHPHGQIWALSNIPGEVKKETDQQRIYYKEKRSSLLSDYLSLELRLQERIVCENEHFVALVPFWAVWPFETMIVSRRHVQATAQFEDNETIALASIIKQLTTKYDNLFETSFPYSAGIHQSPVNDGDHKEWHWHMHFYPPLLRSATVKKFMVGFEMLAGPQRDITPELAAERLKDLSPTHYKLQQNITTGGKKL